MKNLILCGQNETVRVMPGEDVKPGTVGIEGCHVEILRADNGRISLTHADALTNPTFIKREVEWLKNGDPTMPVHRLIVVRKQTSHSLLGSRTSAIDHRTTERVKKFNQSITDVSFDTTAQKVVELPDNREMPIIAVYDPQSSEIIATDKFAMERSDPENGRDVLLPEIRMKEYILNCVIAGKDEKTPLMPPVVYDNRKWIEKFDTLDPKTADAITRVGAIDDRREQFNAIKKILEDRDGPYPHGGSPVWYVQLVLESMQRNKNYLDRLTPQNGR